jgi:hypothetical protein
MTIATPADREFKVLRAGFVRDSIVLANLREGARALVNPETGNPFTEEEIARATRSPGRWYNEAQALDDYGQGEQRNALYLADQIRFDRATGKWLLDYHGTLWGLSLLSATGGAGPVVASGTPGTIIVGSTTIPDDGAHKARDPAGNLYQAFETAVCDAITGNVTVTMVAISTGSGTNPPAGTILTWSNLPPNLQPTATVDDDFTGGTDQETEAEFADRIAAIVQYRPGAGNDSHWRTWAREASNAVEDGFVYPCVLRNGSILVAVTQKRKKARGPLGRIASASTLATHIAYITAPTSPVAPVRSFGIGSTVVSEPSDVVFKLRMQRASRNGWLDAQPFPAFSATTPFVLHVNSQTDFELLAFGDGGKLPGQPAGTTLFGAQAPKMMLWNQAKSEWEQLNVQSIADPTAAGGPAFRVLLSSPPSFTLAAQQWVSPAAGRSAIVAQALQQYFDALGPGDFFDVTTDARGARCIRFPSNIEQWPTDVGDLSAQAIVDALGGTAADAELVSASKTTPSYPAAVQNGPNMLTLGNAGIYAL